MMQRFELFRPVSSEFSLTQRFGANPGVYAATNGHPGIDFDTPEGTPVRAAASGVIEWVGERDNQTKAGDRAGYGWLVIIRHAADFFTWYAHLSPGKIFVRPGQTVETGQELGLSGRSGLSSGAHLHFELRLAEDASSAIDPEPFLISEEAQQKNQTAYQKKTVLEPKSRKSGPVEPGPLEDPIRSAVYQKNGCTIRVALTARPWAVGVDCLVVPAGVPFGKLNGSFAKSWLADIGNSASRAIRKLVNSHVNMDLAPLAGVELTGIVGQRPLADFALPHSPEGRRWVFLATARDPSGSLSPLNLPEMTRGVVEEAVRSGVRRLAMPLVGTGDGKMDPVAAMEAILDTLLIDMDFGGVQEITIATLVPEVLDAASVKLNLYRNNLSQALTQDEAVEQDSLGIAPQVHALAEALILRGMGANLAVGILGSWGSGKTSVMKMIEAHIRSRLKAETRRGWSEETGEGPVSPYIGHFYPIWFNAWNYAKSNLWASLMDTIFVTLDYQLKNDPTRLESPSDMWGILRDRKSQALTAVMTNEGILAGLRADQKSLELDYKKEAFTALSKQGQNLAGNVFQKEVLRIVGDEAPAHIQAILNSAEVSEADMAELFDQLRSLEMIWARLIQTGRKNKIATLIWLVIGILTPVILYWLAYTAQLINPLLVWLAGWAPLVLPALRGALKWTRQVDELFGKYIERAENERQRLQLMADEWIAHKVSDEEKRVSEILKNQNYSPEQVEHELEDLAKASNGGKKNLAALQALIKIKEANLEQQRRRAGMAGSFTTLAEFVQSRLDARLYDKELGLLHQVVNDIRDLTDGLVIDEKRDAEALIKRKKALFPRGPARVMLFIDDLDRCPPARLVEVLEAVQLLLKTPLFVVVLGLDTRYATRALEKEYSGILVHSGDPSGLDYIEKIVQIPYRVRPIDASGLPGFLASQMELVEENENPPLHPASVERPQMPSEGVDLNNLLTKNMDNTGKAPIAKAAARPVIASNQPEKPAKTNDMELPPEIVRFSRQDLVDIQACCSLVSLTPRSIKRLVNVLKLLEVYWFRTQGHDQRREVKQGVIALLVLAAAYPEVLVEIFAQMELRFKDNQFNHEMMGNYLAKLNPDTLRWSGPGIEILKWQFDRFKADVKSLRSVVLPDLPEPVDFLSQSFAGFGLATFNLTRSFSFVGDPSYNLDEDKAKKP